MSAESNGSSEKGISQPMAGGRKQLPPITPGAAPTFAGAKQYDAIVRLRERRRLNQVKTGNTVKKTLPRCPKGRFITYKGNKEETNACSMVPCTPALEDCYMHFVTTTVYQEVATVNSAPDSYWPFLATNEGSEAIYGSEAASEFYWPWPYAATTEAEEGIGETDSNTEVSNINLAGNLYWPVVSTNNYDENIGEVAYNSILNLNAPDCTAVLRIVMGDRYDAEISEQLKNVASLQAPDFSTLLTAMNNAGCDETTDVGHYDVEEMMTKLAGW